MWAPCCVQIGRKLYVPEVVFDNKDKRVTQPKVINMAERQCVTSMRVEGTKSQISYKEGLMDEIKKRGLQISVTSKATAGRGVLSKNERIMAAAPDIRETFIFLEPGHRSREYEQFMQNVFSFTIAGKDMLGKPKKTAVFRRTI